MARRDPAPVDFSELDDDTYSGYNNFCPALTTADIEEYGIGILCRNPEGSRPDTDMSLKWPRTPFPTQQELVQRRETFRGFRIKTESRWMKTPRGIIPRPGTATWDVDMPMEILPQPGADYYMRSGSLDFPLGLTSDPRMDYELTTGTGLSSTETTPRPSTVCGTRTEIASGFGGSPTTSSARRPRTDYGKRIGTALCYRPSTPDRRPRYSMQDTPRPLSRIKAACYIPNTRAATTASGYRTGIEISHLASKTHGEPFIRNKVNSPLDEILMLEKQICELFLECNETLNPENAVKMAKDAQEKEQKLNFVYSNEVQKFPYNTSLTFAVIMNLANQFEAGEMYKEALETYKIISTSKNGVFMLPFRAKINMGNMYVKLGQYPMALKLYHMALDQVPHESASFRAKILRNLGIVFFKTNQLVDAIFAFTNIMDEKPTFTDGLNLMACLYALGSKEDMKTCFELLLATPLLCDNNTNYSTWDVKGNAQLKCLKDGLKFDTLGKFESKIKLEAEKTILMSAQLVAKSICDTIFDGYDWCIEKMKHSQFAHLVGEIQITKATKLMCEKQLAPAIELLKDLQHGSERAKSAAATNLAFIYLTQRDLDEAEKYSSIACAADCYSSSALVNSGCCFMARGHDAVAKAKFSFAVENDALCFEALFDLGLVNKKMGLYVEANCCFSKLHTIFRDDTLVLYQMALLHEITGDVDKAMVRYQEILCLEPRNALILKQVGKLLDETGDVFQAHQYYLDSCRVLPSDVDVLIWLSIYNLNSGVPEEKAIKYINLAIQCQPHEVKWQLMVASCHQRSGDVRKAIECYEEIHKQFPDNIECLRRLVKMCMPLYNQKAKEYALELKKLERGKAISNGIPGTPSSSNITLCSQYSNRSSAQMNEWHSQGHYEMKTPDIYDNLDSSSSSNMIGEEYYSGSSSGSFIEDEPLDRRGEEEIYANQRNVSINISHLDGETILRNESFERCECDDGNAINNSIGELINTRYKPYMRYCLASNGSLEVNWPGVSRKPQFHTSFYNDKFLTNRDKHILPKKSEMYHLLDPRLRQSVQLAASDPVCLAARCVDNSAQAQECRGGYALPFTPRMLFTKVTGGPVGVAHCSVRMSDGDSRIDLHDDPQGQHWLGTPRVLSRECSDDLGLRIFSDSELGADLLPD